MFKSHNIDKIQSILNQIQYKDWILHLGGLQDNRLYVQVRFKAKCTVTGNVVEQRGAKNWLSVHMCKSEIVRAVYKAIQAAELHEMQENFKYNGTAIYSPHISVDALAEAAANLDIRD